MVLNPPRYRLRFNAELCVLARRRHPISIPLPQLRLDNASPQHTRGKTSTSAKASEPRQPPPQLIAATPDSFWSNKLAAWETPVLGSRKASGGANMFGASKQARQAQHAQAVVMSSSCGCPELRCGSRLLGCGFGHLRCEISHLRGGSSYLRCGSSYLRCGSSYPRCGCSYLRCGFSHLCCGGSYLRCGCSYLRCGSRSVCCGSSSVCCASSYLRGGYPELHGGLPQPEFVGLDWGQGRGV